MSHLRKIKRRRGKSGRSSTRPTAETNAPERIELQMTELEAVIERSKAEPLNEQDCERLRSVLQTLYFLTQELEKKRVSVQRLKQLLFGAATEKTRKVIEKALEEAATANIVADDDPAGKKPPP